MQKSFVAIMPPVAGLLAAETTTPTHTHTQTHKQTTKTTTHTTHHTLHTTHVVKIITTWGQIYGTFQLENNPLDVVQQNITSLGCWH